MTYFYFDASALAKRYIQEVGTDLINDLFANVSFERLTCLAIGALEVATTLRNVGDDLVLVASDKRLLRAA